MENLNLNQLEDINGGKRNFWQTAGKVGFCGGVTLGVTALAGPVAGVFVGGLATELFDDAVPVY